MMHPRAQLRLKTRVIFEGETWEIVELTGDWVVLARAGRPPTRLLINRLVGSVGFRLADDLDGLPPAAGPAFEQLDRDEYERMLELESHLRELRTGYRRGCFEKALPGEPRPEYLPGLSMMTRYESKAAELGMAESSVRRLLKDYETEGFLTLLDNRRRPGAARNLKVHPRWVECIEFVLGTETDLSQTTRQLVLDKARERCSTLHPEARVPADKSALRWLRAHKKGQFLFKGTSAKNKRSKANGPGTPYGRMRSYRFGEYVLLDTTTLDVFAYDPITMSWVQLQLTVAMDLATRCILGLRLSPVSANAVDAAMVLFETLNPNSVRLTNVGILPYGGLPFAVLGEWTDKGLPEKGLPGGLADTIVVDHGKMYMSRHIGSVCQHLGISLQPVRKLRPTDKSVLERWFRTLGDSLLEALPGYKGPDVFSRGKSPEDLAYYFIHELEQMIREWIVEVYHLTPHRSLRHPGLPGVRLSPDQMRDELACIHGEVVIPRRLELVYDFLPAKWRTIQHYGVEVNGFRYDGPGLEGYRNQRSTFLRADGKWPIRFDPDDATRVYFQRPDDNSWHTLTWDQALEDEVPFSVDLGRYAKKLAIELGQDTERFGPRAIIAQLLERWDHGLIANPTEKRLALRHAEQVAARLKLASLDPLDMTEDTFENAGAIGSVYTFTSDQTAEGRDATGDDDSLQPEDMGAPVVESDEGETDFYGDAFGVGA